MQLGPGFERLFFFIIMSLMVLHIISCMWVFMAKISSEDRSDTWIGEDYAEYADKEHSHLYLISLYYVITSMTTVGYGDISPTKIN